MRSDPNSERRPGVATTVRARVILLLLSTVVCVGVAELVARAFRQARAVEPVVPRELGRFDPNLGWSPRPGAVAASQRTGEVVEYRINSQGLRDSDTPYAKPEGVVRIVALGDSRTFGFGNPIEDHYTALLETMFDSVEVVNLGVSGFGVDQELLYLRSEGLRYDPDIVMVYVSHYADDRHMHTRRFGKPKPRFVLEDGKLVLINSPVEEPTDRFEGGTWRRVDGWMLDNVELYRLACAAWAGMNVSEQAASAGDDRGFRRERDRLGEAIVFAMHNEARAHGADFLLVTELDALHRAATARGIDSFHPGPRLTAAELSLGPELGHLNAAGNRELASGIAAHLSPRLGGSARGLLAGDDP